MRARHRHFVARDAGAQMTMDARYIAQSDNTAVSAWANRGSSSYDMSQATSTAQPTFRDGTNGLNGFPTLSFDGGDYLTGINTAVPTFSIVAVAVRSASGANPETMFSRGITTAGKYSRDALMYYLPNSTYAAVSNSSETAFPICAATGVLAVANVLHGRLSGGVLGMRVNGGAETTLSATTSVGTNAAWAIGAHFESTTILYYFRSKISLVAVFNQAPLSDPLRKRVTHAAGFSYKIACS